MDVLSAKLGGICELFKKKYGEQRGGKWFYISICTSSNDDEVCARALPKTELAKLAKLRGARWDGDGTSAHA